ncbi:TPA: replication protein [Escherichia coli]|uniref:replication protein n=1 Tax=Escherichia coli TaxID=562 RepID=UPI0003EFAE0F|nr:replication protein [Escherichia coli]EAB6196605.1 replication protein [Escherichia coli]EAB9719359.1 replication protein [Escherichia coli]EFK2378180.1 replication protein [Escherichia coli]EFK2499335.1 replication protein [Escherichia coli]EFK2634307.1 replication protein [Escherichia coli]
MTNTAKILNFGRGNFAGQERNVADLDDGYARLSNMLLEAYSGADLTKRQFKVLLAILRRTYGWNKPMDRITDSQLSEITKLPVKRCNEAKLELVRMNIIKQQGGMFGPNKNISEWCIPQNEGKSPKTRDKTSLKLGDCYPCDKYEFGKPVDHQQVIWNRERISNSQDGIVKEIKGADTFIFGHTPAVKPLKFANQMYIDTGAVFCGNLTLIQVQGEGA